MDNANPQTPPVPQPVNEKPASPPTTATPPVTVPPKLRLPKPKIKESQEIIRKLEEKLGSKVICYYTNPNTFIGQSHPDLFFDHLRSIGSQENLVLVVVSNGGESTASLRIATIIREYCKTLTIVVPSVCASAATNLALSGDKILMSSAGFLTAIDTTLYHELGPKDSSGRPAGVSVDQIKRILQFLNNEGTEKQPDGALETPYRTLFKYVHPVVIGEIDRVSSNSELIATKMMSMHPHTFENQEKIKSIAHHLVNNYPTHGFPILYNEAKEIGLPVEKVDRETSDLLYDLVKNYNATTLSYTTHLNPAYYHLEAYSVIIESRAKRTSYRISYNKRFNPITKGWQLENDNSQWVNIVPNTNPEVKAPYIILPIDTPDNPEPLPQAPTPLPDQPLKKYVDYPSTLPTGNEPGNLPDSHFSSPPDELPKQEE